MAEQSKEHHDKNIEYKFKDELLQEVVVDDFDDFSTPNDLLKSGINYTGIKKQALM